VALWEALCVAVGMGMSLKLEINFEKSRS